MTERPILFSGPMVRAILDGRKTQTRRPVNSPGNCVHADGYPIKLFGEWGLSEDPISLDDAQAHGLIDAYYPWRPTRRPGPGDWLWTIQSDIDDTFCHVLRCPYGQPGDRLWVRETWACPQSITYYRATDDGLLPPGERWRPSIHMPRWASRLTLEVTDVRVERVQAISEADAMAEGVRSQDAHVVISAETGIERALSGTHRGAFACLWDSIYAARGLGWSVDPWVWVVSYRVVEVSHV